MTDAPATEGGGGAILPTWTAVEAAHVNTTQELWEQMRVDGWNVDVRLQFDSLVRAR
jgi:hypothetical protein